MADTPLLNRTALLNALIARIDAHSYLEIGVNNGRSFAAIRCEHKVGVDPKPVDAQIVALTSDKFFATNQERFDVIFVDGLHEAEQVHRDIVNALAALNEGGFIVCHDMNPWSEKTQLVPYPGGSWTGDCWKAFVRLRRERSDLEMCVVDIDCGCAVIRRGSQTPLAIRGELNYRALARHRSEWLNLVTAEAFDEWLRGDMRAPLVAQPTQPLWRAALQALGAAGALMAVFLAVFLTVLLIVSFVYARIGPRDVAEWDIIVALIFGPLSIVFGATFTLLYLPLAAAAAVPIGIYAALPRPQRSTGDAIKSAAKIFMLLPASMIGAIVGLKGYVAVVAMETRQLPYEPTMVGRYIVALTCIAMLFPTICYATIRAVQSLPRSRRDPRFHPALTRGEFVRSVVLPNARTRIIVGLGIAFGRVVCDVFVVVIWFVSIAAGMYGNSLLLASILSLGITAVSWWLLRRGRLTP